MEGSPSITFSPGQLYRRWRSFAVFGISYMVDPTHWDLTEPATIPPDEMEYIGDVTIGFRCALADNDILISSTDFARMGGPAISNRKRRKKR
jgi:hypothetical protein